MKLHGQVSFLSSKELLVYHSVHGSVEEFARHSFEAKHKNLDAFTIGSLPNVDGLSVVDVSEQKS